jgi:hypothetical protein
MKTHVKRELTFRSVWDSAFLEASSSLKLQFQPAATTTKPPLSSTTPGKTPNSGGAMMDISLIQSPSEAVLLSHILTNRENNTTKHEAKRLEARGPLIIPLKSYYQPERKTTSNLPPPPTMVPVRREVLSPPTLPEPLSATMTPSVETDSVARTTPDPSKEVMFTPTPPPPYESPLLVANGYPSPTVHAAPVASNSHPSSVPPNMENEPSPDTSTPKRKEMSPQRMEHPTSPSTEKELTWTSTPKREEGPYQCTEDKTPTGTKSHMKDINSTPFTPSKVKKLSRKNKEKKGSARILSNVLGTVYKNVAPAVAHSSYAIGSTVVTKIAPAVASSSYKIGSAVTNKIAEKIVGNSSHDFRKANELKLHLLKELSEAKAALDIDNTAKEHLQGSNLELFRENVSLRAEFEQKLQMTRIEQVSGNS